MTFVSHCATTRRQLPGQGSSRGRFEDRSSPCVSLVSVLVLARDTLHVYPYTYHTDRCTMLILVLHLAADPSCRFAFFLALTIMQVHVRYPLLWSLLLILFYSPPTEVTARTFALDGRGAVLDSVVSHTHIYAHTYQGEEYRTQTKGKSSCNNAWKYRSMYATYAARRVVCISGILYPARAGKSHSR